MITIGIDPGKQGAIVTVDEAGCITKQVMPVIGKVLDLHKLKEIMLGIARQEQCHAYIEDVHAIYGASAGSTFSFGFGCAAVQMGCVAFDIPMTLVQPKRWQSLMYVGVPEIRRPSITIKTGKRAGQKMKGKKDTKKMSLVAVQRLFPGLDLRRNDQCKIPHDGIVDALLIAAYGVKIGRRHGIL
jgi:hypothetical protein